MSARYDLTHNSPASQPFWYENGCKPLWWGVYDWHQRRFVAQCPTREAALAALRLLSGGEP